MVKEVPSKPGIGEAAILDPQAGGLYQLAPEDEAIVTSYAQQKGLTKADAVRTLLQHRQGKIEDRSAQPTVMEKTLGAIGEAQTLGVASNDPNDVINAMGRGVVIKSLAKGLNGDDGSNSKKTNSFDEIKDMMYLRIMANLAGVNDNKNDGNSTIVQDMKSENEKLRQDLKDAEAKRVQEQKDAETRRQADMEKLEGKMRDMLFEKKIEKLEEKAAVAQTSVIQEIKNLSEKVDLYRSIPTGAAPERKDAVSELEEIGGKLDRIKKALAPMFPQALAPTAPGLTVPASLPPALKNPDGSTDYLAAAERIGAIVVRGIEAATKKPPVAAEVAVQPAQPPAQQTYTERRMGLDEYADYVLSLKERTPEQQQWLINYQAHLEREQAKLRPMQSTELPAVQPYKPPAEPAAEIHPEIVAEQPAPEPEQQEQQPEAGLIDELPAQDEGQPAGAGNIEEQPQEQPVEENPDVVDKMQREEVERSKRLQGVV